jgi:hypothetical protein
VAIGWFVLTVAGPLMDRALAGEEITVALASGRTFVGQVDSQTNQDVLWLRVTHGPIQLLRPIEWSRVVRGWQAGKLLTTAELQVAAHSLQSERPGRPEPSRREVPAPPAPCTDKPAIPAPPLPATSLAPVTSLEIDAQLGHWTPTVETSGFVVSILPLNADGQLTPISGTLEVDLVGQLMAGYNTAGDFPSVGHWTMSVSSADFGPSGAAYRCPFQAVHPDFDHNLRPLGLVHARLSVPGQGVFEASQALVRIRPYSSIRDRNQQTTGDRFFPFEQTSRGSQ